MTALGLATGWSAGVACADEPLPTSGPGTIVTIGGFGLWQPKFEGAKRNELAFRPVFGLHAPGSKEWLDLPNDGIDYEFVETDNFRAGVVGNFRLSRDTNSLVRGFKRVRSIDVAIEAGGFAEFWPAEWLRTRVEVRDAALGADGVVGDLSADVVLHPANRWTATAGPRISFASQAFMNSYYSVDAKQSATSGLRQYSSSAGLRSYGAGASLRYKWSDAWTTTAFAEYTRLAPNAAESPLIDERGSPDQLTIGIGAKYSFYSNW